MDESLLRSWRLMVPGRIWIQTDGGCRQGVMGGGMSIRVAVLSEYLNEAQWKAFCQASYLFGLQGDSLTAEVLTMVHAVNCMIKMCHAVPWWNGLDGQ